ncbi:LacI family DNA-binding transcriptional regulator [Olivibacter sp. SDN3]|uniref:LacI family DNA-binding transcriptional regulator n=1 Tax=Olivibacter sp. SDN3 TaxID=2764720 RepID=UPI0016518A72|nr:LacI family DNA-binding transcriptional regulator [Olivibacter sp. SDN3]QNL51776.1 LacI family DNA-binding transcriptional regulator [Olivibacter sp. SDN3]
MKRITIKDLSKHLSLSTSTISRAFVNDKSIHPETKKRVLQAAEKLGYKPNPAALNLKYGQSKNIGFVVPEMVTPFSTAVLRGIQKTLNPQGYRIIILQSDESPAIERQHLLFLEEFNVEAIIINLCHETYNQDLYQEILERGTPLIFFDRIPSTSLNVSKVIVNDHIKASLMVEHLIGIGRKRIAHIMGPSSIRNATERAMGYQRILTKHQLFDQDLIVKTEGIGFEYGRNAVRHLMHKKVQFDAIFAFTDTLAIGAMNFLLENNVKIPDEVAIASFSGTELSTIVYPALTTVEQPLEKMGEAAAELVLEKIQGGSVASRTIVLAPELVYRGSTEHHS